MRSVSLILIFLFSLIAANAEIFSVARSFYENQWTSSPLHSALSQSSDAYERLNIEEPRTSRSSEFLMATLNIGLLPTSLRVTESDVSSRFVDDNGVKRQLDWHLAGAVALVFALIYSIYLHPLII